MIYSYFIIYRTDFSKIQVQYTCVANYIVFKFRRIIISTIAVETTICCFNIKKIELFYNCICLVGDIQCVNVYQYIAQIYIMNVHAINK